MSSTTPLSRKKSRATISLSSISISPDLKLKNRLGGGFFNDF